MIVHAFMLDAEITKVPGKINVQPSAADCHELQRVVSVGGATHNPSSSVSEILVI